MQFIDIYSFYAVEILWGVCTCRAAVTLMLLSQAHLMKAKAGCILSPGKNSVEGSMDGGRTQGISFSAIYHFKQSKLV